MNLLWALGVAMILSDGKDYTLQYVDNGDGGVEARYVLTANAPEAINPNSLESVLKAMTGQTVEEWTQAQANKKDPGWGSFARETLSQPAFTIPAAFLTAGAAGAFGEGGVAGLADAVQPGVFGGAASAAPTSLADLIPGSNGQLLAQVGGGVSDSAAGATGGVDWSQPFTSTTGVGAVAPGTNFTGALTLGGAGAGALGTGAASGAAAAGAGAVLPKASSNDTPGETSVAPGVVGPGSSPGLGSPSSSLGTTLGNSAAAGGVSGALGRIIDGTASTADYIAAMGAAGTTGLSIAGANAASNAQTDLANKYMSYGEPSRARYEASMSPTFDPMSIPGYSAALDNSSNSILRKLSVSGNPYGSPAALIEANKAVVSGTALPALQEYQRVNAGAGGLAALTSAAPAASNAAINANQSIYAGLGYGLDQATNPGPTSLAALLKQYQSKSPAFV